MELNRAARLTLSTLRMPGWTRMLLLMAGTKLASVTRIYPKSGSRLGKAKLPFSSVNIFWERRSCRLNSMTSAPICGTPSPLVTEPAMAPDSLTDTAPETGLAAARHTNPKTTLDTEMCVLVVIVRRCLAYHLAYPAVGIGRRNRLPTSYVTVNWALGVRVWFRFLSVIFNFNVYCPGCSFDKGSSFSTVTCE